MKTWWVIQKHVKGDKWEDDHDCDNPHSNREAAVKLLRSERDEWGMKLRLVKRTEEVEDV